MEKNFFLRMYKEINFLKIVHVGARSWTSAGNTKMNDIGSQPLRSQQPSEKASQGTGNHGTRGHDKQRVSPESRRGDPLWGLSLKSMKTCHD